MSQSGRATEPEHPGETSMSSKALPILIGALVAAVSFNAQARMTRITITKVESPTFEGRSFGGVGPYEKLIGRISGEVDPADAHNSVITDIALAPRNANGKVEYETDIMIFRPVDRTKGNHKTWFELTNRGYIAAFSQFNDAPGTNNPTRATDAGNGFLMNQGYSILLSGWDTTAPAVEQRFTTKAPVAVNKDGSPIIGPSMEEFVVDDTKTTSGKLTYPAASLDKSKATLAIRFRTDDPPTMIATEKWDFANEAGTAIKLSDGAAFQQGALYEFTYQARDPVVSGLGFAALRDVASFVKNTDKDDAGTANPLKGDAT